MELQQTTSQDSIISQSQPVSQSNLKTVLNSTNNTFSMNTIVPITRTIKVNSHCYSIYSTLHKIPLAVHQFIDKPTIQGFGTRQGKDFYQQPAEHRQDQKFYIDPTFYQLTKAAKAPLSFDKGHMAPASNYLGDQASLDATYTYANCIPQNSYFNRGSWKNLESYCRNLLRNSLCDTVQIISGPVFYSSNSETYNGIQNVYENKQIIMMQNGIVVPPKCYKIIKANKNDLSYVSAFVMKNDKIIDNEYLLKSFIVQIDKLQFMTGLRFNLGVYRPLEELDPNGLNKTMGDLHLQFYTKLFKNAKTLADMNTAKKQGYMYHVKVDKDSLPSEDRIKIAKQDFQNIINQKDWVKAKCKARRKINSLLGLHKDAKDLDALSEQLDKQIRANIQFNIEPSKLQSEKQYHKWIAGKLYKNNYGYHYPFEQQLKAIFPSLTQKQQKDDNEQISQNSQNVSVNKSLFTPKNQNHQDESTTKSSMKKSKESSSKKSKPQQGSSSKLQQSEGSAKKSDDNLGNESETKKVKKVYKQKKEKQCNHQNNQIKLDEETIKVPKSKKKAEQKTQKIIISQQQTKIVIVQQTHQKATQAQDKQLQIKQIQQIKKSLENLQIK